MEDIIPETEKQVHEEELMESESKKSEERSNGSMNHFLPKLVCEKEVENNNGHEIKGGIINHIISNLVSPMSPKAVDFSFSKNGDSISSNGESEDMAKNGGVMNNLISNLFHHSEEHREKEDDEEENSKGGLIDNIVSHFPTSIPDDAVPTTDEASILIHSIVKD